MLNLLFIKEFNKKYNRDFGGVLDYYGVVNKRIVGTDNYKDYPNIPILTPEEWLILNDFPEKWAINGTDGSDIHKWFEKILNRPVSTGTGGVCYFHFPEIGLDICTSSFVYKRYTEITEEQFNTFKKYYVMEETIPERWCIKGCEELAAWQRKEMNDKCNVYFYDTYYYYTDDTGLLKWKHDTFINGTEITFEQFYTHIYSPYKQKQMEKKKIIGYKCPVDMVGGNNYFTKKGDLFVKYPGNDNLYVPEKTKSAMLSVPAALVEATWEAVYGEEEKKYVLKSGKSLTIQREGVNTGNRVISIDDLKPLLLILKTPIPQ